jgi:hypothetical protein
MLSRARKQLRSPLRRRGALQLRLEALEIRLTPSATQLVVISPPPATVAAGQAFGLTLAAEDGSGNVDPSYSGTATVALANNPGGSTLSGAGTASFNNGLASFTGLSLNEPGDDYSLQATSAGLAPPPSSTMTFNVAPQLVATSSPPATVTAGQAFGLTLTAEDASGNVDFSYNAAVTLALASNPGGAVLGGTTTISFSNGSAQFTALTVDRSGSAYSLVASSDGLSSPPSGSPTFNVIAATAARLAVISPPPGTVTAGQAFGLNFAAEDNFGNITPNFSGSVTLALASNPGGGTLTGTTSTSFNNGLASFTGLSLNKSGSGYSLVASSAGLSPPPSSSMTFNVIPAAPSQLAVTTPPPATVTAGQAFGLTAAVEDQYGNVVAGFSGNLAVAPTNTAAEGALGGILTVTVAADGHATFTGLTLIKPGAALTLQVAASGFSNVTTSPFSVLPATATQLVVTTAPPALVTAGSSFGLVLAAEDPYGNVNPSFSGTASIALNSNPTGDTLAGTTTESFSGGLATFAGLTLQKPGTGYSFQASASGLGSPSPSALTFNVEPVATRLVVTNPPPAAVIAGQPFGLTVSAEDAFGNVDAAFSGSATLTMGNNPGNGILSGLTTVSFSGGMASFSGLNINQPGSGYTLAATTNGLASTNTLSFNVVSPLTQLVVTSPPPANVVAGKPFGLSVAAEDALGNVDPTFAGNVTVSLVNNPGGGTLGGTTSATFSNGLANFSGLTLTAAGSGYSILLASNGLASAKPISLSFNVTPGAASQLVVTSPPPASVDAGQTFGLTVAVEDQFGNVVTEYGGNLAVAPTNASEGSLGGDITMPVSGGVAAFAGLSLIKPGTDLTLQVSATGLPSATTSPFTVAAGPATQLVVTTAPPADVAAGVGFGLTLAAEDQYGNVNPEFSGTVSLALTGGPGPAPLTGTTKVQFDGGVATFSGLMLTTAGSGYSLLATATGLTAPPASAMTFGVTAGAATQLVLTYAPPADVTAGVGFSLNLAAEDQYGNVDPSFTGSVTLALADNPSGAALGGTAKVSFSNGVAVFTGLSLDTVSAELYTFQATSQGLAPTASLKGLSVTVTAAPATQLVVLTPPPATVTAGSPFGISIAAEDQYGNVDTAFGGSATVALASDPGGGILGGTTTTQFSNGLASFSTLTLNAAASGYSLLAASNGLTPPLSTDTLKFDVTAAAATKLVVTSPPPAEVAPGAGFGLTVAAEDQYGNINTSFNGTVSVALAGNPAGGALGGTLAVAAARGEATFSGLNLSTAGNNYTLQATGAGLTAATTGSIDVTSSGTTGSGSGSSGSSSSGGGSSGSTGSSGGSSGTTTTSTGSSDSAPELAVYGYPTAVVAGNLFDLSVVVEGPTGTDDTSFTGAVTLSLATDPGGATLGGNLNMPVIHGVVTFYGLSLNAAGSGYVIRAMASGADPATTSPIAVSDPPARLAVTAPPPSNLAANQAFGLIVTVEDASGNAVAGYEGSVTIAWAGKHGKSPLHGTLTASVVDGVATFSGLTLGKVRKGYTLQLRATASGLIPAMTNPIGVSLLARRASHMSRISKARHGA